LGTLICCLPIRSHLSFSFSFFFFFTVLQFSDLSSRCLRVFFVLSLFLCWLDMLQSTLWAIVTSSCCCNQIYFTWLLHVSGSMHLDWLLIPCFSLAYTPRRSLILPS
jgi:hypothetical protein